MKRYLIPQMLHDWRSNFWLIIELLIVTIVVAFLTFMLSSRIRNLVRPLGFDYEDVYTLSLEWVNEESPEYIDFGDEKYSKNLEDTRTMIARLRANSHVEAVAVSRNATPFVLNYQGNPLSIEGYPDSLNYNGNLRMASPDIVRVLRLKPLSGITPEEMEKRLRAGEIFISETNPIYPHAGKEYELVGKRVCWADTVYNHKIGGVTQEIRRSSFDTPDAMILWPINEDEMAAEVYGYQLILRVKKGEGPAFLEDVSADPSLRRLRNVAVNDLTPLETLRSSTERNQEINMRLYVAMVIFFLVIIYLGLLGTFWYRVQQRSGEIALRKVAGATRSDILRRLLSEGSLIFLGGFIPAVGICLILFFKLMLPNSIPSMVWPDFWISLVSTYIIMQIVVIIGILFPASKAMSLEPAIVLKDE